MAEALGGAIVLAGTYLIAALLRRYTSMGTTAAVALGLVCVIGVGVATLGTMAVYDGWKRDERAAAHQKELCEVRRKLGIDPNSPDLVPANC